MDLPAKRRAALLFVLYLGVVGYFSLYPGPFVGIPPGARLKWVSVVGRAQMVDVILNVVFYVPLGAAAFGLFRRGFGALLGATLLCASISLAMEYMQLAIPSRDGGLRDIVVNGFGGFLGAALMFIGTGPTVAQRLRSMPPFAGTLAALWILWQASLLLPRRWSSIDWGHEVVGLLLLGLAMTRMERPTLLRIALPPLLLWLAFEELRPFHFQGPPQHFSWIPFQSWFTRAADSYYGTVFGKTFLYAAIIGMLRRSGCRWWWSMAIPAAILGLGEWGQRYLPGRTPELTELVQVAAGGLLLFLTE